jgi:predicted secreted Zn-dependent protease
VVRGATSRAIFNAIDANGLSDGKGRRAVGLTSGHWTLDWLGRHDGSGFCNAPSMTITLELVVTLPQLDQPDGPSPDIEAKWQRFAARVAEHEQRHVDIYLEGAKRMQTRMEAALATPSSCAALQTTIRGIWASQQAETEESQERFHLEDDGKSQTDRTPLQAQIDTNRARLTAIESEAREADRALEELAREISATRARIDVVETKMAELASAPFSCSQSRPTPRLHALCQQYDSLATAHHALVGRHNGIVQRRRALREEHIRAIAVTNDLIEVLNWTR